VKKSRVGGVLGEERGKKVVEKARPSWSGRKRGASEDARGPEGGKAKAGGQVTQFKWEVKIPEPSHWITGGKSVKKEGARKKCPFR